jgi:formate/nitrite transporter
MILFAFSIIFCAWCRSKTSSSTKCTQKIIFGAFGLPFGLIMTLVTGAELFTGNTALVTAAKMEGKTSTSNLVKNWVASYAGNFVGSLFLAYLAFKSGTLGAAPASVAIATAKCSLPFATTFVRGILCNWLVCMAVYMASGCASLAGKMVAVWFPISAFVALGLEHSVANMFIIPLGIMRGANVSTMDFLTKNLLPVTLGNIVGGALCVMGLYGTAFGNWFKPKEE